MLIQRQFCRVLSILGLALLVASPAAAQSEPEFVPYVNDLQFFDQPDLSSYGRGVARPEGWFGTAEFLNWSIQAPPKTSIGSSGSYTVYQVGARTPNTGNAVPNITTAATGFSGTRPSNFFGVPNFVPTGGSVQTSSMDTGTMSSEFTSGSRYEFGRINNDRGWMVGTLYMGTQTQEGEGSGVAVNFDNAPIGFVLDNNLNMRDIDGDGFHGSQGPDRNNPRDGIPNPLNVGDPPLASDFDDAVFLPTVFQRVAYENKTSMYGVELMRLWRVAQGPRGGSWEFFGGPRYVNVKDQFNVEATATNDSSFDVPVPFVDSYWNTNVANHVFGLQLGGRWSRQMDRWQLNFEGRGLAAANWQNAKQAGEFSNEYTFRDTTTAPPTTTVVRSRGVVLNGQVPHSFNDSFNEVAFTPGAEIRANLKYQVFRSVYVQLGYTALYMNNIARANQLVQYNFPDMGLNEDANKQHYFANGVDFGITVNR